MAGTELAVGYISLVPSAKGIVGGIEKELGGPLAAAGTKSGAATSTSFKTAFKSGIKNLAVPVAVIGGIAAIGEKFNNAFNTIARGTGATGKTLEGLDNSFRTVLKNGSGSFDQVSAAVTTLYQRTGLTGKALDDFAGKQVTLARITKTDVAANLQATTGLFNLYGIAASNQSAKLDVLFRASQVAGVTITQLASDMQAAAPTAKVLGLTIDQTAALVANLDKAGLPASKVMLGLASAFVKAAKSGQDPLTVIHSLVDEVKKAPNATVAATIAVQKFGIGARQASVLVAGLRSGAINLDATLADGKGILATAAATQTLTGKFAHLKNEALVGLEPLAKQALGAVTKGVEELLPVVGFLSDHMDALGPIILTAAGAFIAFKTAVGISKLITATQLAFTALKTALVQTTVAEAPLAGAAAETTVALEAETVAATEAAAATGAAGLALTTLGTGTVVAAGAVAGGFLVKTLYDLFAISTKATVHVRGFTDAFAAGLLGTSKSAIDAKSSIDGLAGAMEKWAKAQGDAGEQTGASTLINQVAANRTTFQAATTAVLGGAGAIDQYVASMKNLSGPAAESLRAGLHTLADSLQQQAKATILNLVNTKQVSKAQADSAIQMRTSANGAHDYVAALSQLGTVSATVTAAEGATKAQLDAQRQSWTLLTLAIIENTDSQQNAAQSITGILSASVGAQQSVLAAADAQKTYAEFVKKGTQNTEDGKKALLAYQSAALGVRSASLGGAIGAEQWAKQTSGLADAQKRLADIEKKTPGDTKAIAAATDQVGRTTEVYRKTLEGLAAQTSGPVHDAIVQYLKDTANTKAAVDKVPATKTTTLFVAKQAADTSLASWKHELADTATSFTTTLHLDTGPAFQDLIRFTHSIPGITLPVGGIQRRAKGGPVKAGQQYLVGEGGKPEILDLFPGGGGFVTSGDDLRPLSPTASLSAVLRPAEHTPSARPPITFTGPIYTRDERALFRELDNRVRKAEILAGF